MSRRLLEDTGVAFLPGSDFGRSPEELTARLAYVDFNGRAALEAVEDIPGDQALDDNFVKTHCGRVIEAIDRINEWVIR